LAEKPSVQRITEGTNNPKEQTTMITLEPKQLRSIVPAAFADTPSDRVSDRYAFISTADIVDELQDHGWHPVRARQNRKGDLEHGTHMITFRRPDWSNIKAVNDTVPEINLVNSHNTERRARLMAGFWRLICSNGLMVSAGIAELSACVTHRGDAALVIDDALDHALESLDEAVESITEWRGIELTELQQGIFAQAAGQLRFDKPFDAHTLLERRRQEDEGNDLWTVFNVIQENLIKGGIRPMSNRATRGITAVSANERINCTLWDLAEAAAERIRKGQSLS
jgi:hypothetical protein